MLYFTLHKIIFCIIVTFTLRCHYVDKKKIKKVDIANSDLLNNILFCRANNIFDAALVLLAFYLIIVLVACFYDRNHSTQANGAVFIYY